MGNEIEAFNVRINVNGTVHNVKVEKGVKFVKNKDSLEKPETIFWAEGDNKIGTMTNISGDTWQYPESEIGKSAVFDAAFKAKYAQTTEINMNEAEFSIFKSVADNNKENGDQVILSQKDIDTAEELYRMGEFTNDISNNLPAGYKAERSQQVLETYDTPVVGGYLTNEKTDEKEGLSFIRSSEYGIVEDLMIDVAKSAPNGECYVAIDGENNCTTDIDVIKKDEDGKIYHYSLYGDEDNAVEYDEDGKHIYDTKTYTETVYKSEDGTAITETLYKKDANTKIIDYEKDGYKKTETYDSEGNLIGVLEEYTDKNGAHVRKFSTNGNLKSLSVYNDSAKKNFEGTFDETGKLLKATAKDGEFYYRFSAKNNKLEVCRGDKPFMVKEGDKTTHYINGMTLEQYMLKNLRGE